MNNGEKKVDYVDYAVKLGYERRLAEMALQRLGGSPSTDIFLRTVINLKKEEELKMTCKRR